MLKYIPFHNKRLQPAYILIIAAILLLLASSLQKINTSSSAKAAIIPHEEADNIVVQLFQVPGFIYPSINGVPEWTLYADGTLIFKPDSSSDLLQAHLSTESVRSILNVILVQNHFFASTKDSYGRYIPDVGSLLLTLNSNGQRKQVRLLGKPDAPLDVETQHVFAIKDFLLNYHPTVTQPYTPPAVALLALPQDGNSTGLLTWPYKDISLAQVAILECPLLSPGSNSCPATIRNKAGIVAIFGQRGLALMQLAHSTAYSRVQAKGKIYRLITWPLLPDALNSSPNGVPGIEVHGASNATWPLYLTYIRSWRSKTLP